MQHFRTEKNPYTGATERFYWDDQEKKLHVKKTHDVTDILEANKRAAADTHGQRHGDGMLHHVAEIPLTMVYEWQKEGIDLFSKDPDMKRRVRQRLNDPAYRFLRTRDTRL